MTSCAFCGTTDPMSDEDIWPVWLSTHFKRAFNAKLFQHHITSARAGQSQREISQRVNMRAPVVCKPCNTKWMSQLENITKSVLVPLIDSPQKHRSLSRVDLLALANWMSVKSVAMNHLALRDNLSRQRLPFFTPQQRATLMARCLPPTRTTIWLGRAPAPTTPFFGDLDTVYYLGFARRSPPRL